MREQFEKWFKPRKIAMMSRGISMLRIFSLHQRQREAWRAGRESYQSELEPVYQFIMNNHQEDGYAEWVDCNQEYFNSTPEGQRRILFTSHGIRIKGKTE